MPSNGPTTEIGTVTPASGLPQWAAFIDTSDHVPELNWPLSIRVYDEMRKDSQVDALKKAVTLPLLRRRFVLDPNGARDEVVRELSEDLGVPVRGQDPVPTPRRARRFSHRRHLQTVLDFALDYGHLFDEQVGEVIDGKWRLRKLAPRLPRTISQIQTAPDGGLLWIKQNIGISAPEIPVSRLVAYVWQQEPGSWVGRSMLRPLYRHWVLKDRLLRIDAMKHERNGIGVPVLEAPPGATDPELDRLAQIAQNWRAGEYAGVAVPAGTKVSLVSGNGGTETIESARYHDEAMARDFLAMFIQLGQTQTGSRALAGEFTDFFALSLDAIADWYCDVTTEHVIEDWVDWNYGEGEPAPILTYDTEDPELAIGDLVSLIQSGAIVVDDELETELRERHNLPPRSDASQPRPTPQAVPAPGSEEDLAVAAALGTADDAAWAGEVLAADAPTDAMGRIRSIVMSAHKWGGNGKEPSFDKIKRVLMTHHPEVIAKAFGGDPNRAAGWIKARWYQLRGRPVPGHKGHHRKHVMAAADVMTNELRLPKRELRRRPYEHEVMAATDFDRLDRVWQKTLDQLVKKWAKEVTPKQAQALVAQIRKAKDGEELTRLTAPTAGAGLLARAMLDVALDGMKGAQAEAAEQGVTITLPTQKEVEQEAKERAAIVAAMLANNLAEAASRKAVMHFAGDPVQAADAVRDHLAGLKTGFLEGHLGGALTAAQNSGRRTVMEAGPSARYFASELLDGNTCKTCRQIDGKEYGSLAEAMKDYPTGGHLYCEGGPRCRGAIVAVYDEDQTPV